MLKKVFILLGIALILTGCTNEFPQVGTSSSYAPPYMLESLIST